MSKRCSDCLNNEVKREMRKKIVFLILLIICVLPAKSQVSVEAEIDSIQIFIGEQAHLTLRATMPEGATAMFPVFKPSEMVTPGIEVLSSREEGVKSKDNGVVERTVIYTLTSFDDTLYYLPPLEVKVDGKAYKSKSLALKVLPFEVDTLHLDKFFGPKDVQDNPFLWSEWRLLFWLSILMLVLLGVGGFLYYRLRSGKPIMAAIRIVKRLLPHQKAMKEIEQIKADKMVTSENQKEYYTKLTETLRKYIEERYGFSAMEMTSSEIIERLTAESDQKMLDELRQLFSTADLVKFAKYSTLINENDANLVNAIDFINQTKIENMPQEETVKPQLSAEDERQLKTRKVLKAVIIGLAVISFGLLCYVVYGVCQLLM